MGKFLKVLKKISKMDFISVKLQTYSVQTAHLLKAELTTDYFWKMFQKLVVLKENFSKKLWYSSVLIECSTAVQILQFYQNQSLPQTD